MFLQTWLAASPRLGIASSQAYGLVSVASASSNTVFAPDSVICCDEHCSTRSRLLDYRIEVKKARIFCLKNCNTFNKIHTSLNVSAGWRERGNAGVHENSDRCRKLNGSWKRPSCAWAGWSDSLDFRCDVRQEALYLDLARRAHSSDGSDLIPPCWAVSSRWRESLYRFASRNSGINYGVKYRRWYS